MNKLAAYMKMMGFFWLLFHGIDYANHNFVPQIQQFNKKYKRKPVPIVKSEIAKRKGLVRYDIVTSNWGWRNDPFTFGTRFHRGIDFAGRYGAGIPAIASGQVVKISKGYRGCGHYVVVKINEDIFNKYCHMSNIYVKRGDSIEKGDLVGSVGSTGRSTGPHLHFEVTDSSGVQLDPRDFFDSNHLSRNHDHYHTDHTGGN
jgi:murein DD-endopeptidase MepM/ murein hydrolase activator NlpD